MADESGAQERTVPTITPVELDRMARMVMMEAGSEPDAGQHGVAAVILNRADSGRYGNGIIGVLEKPHQFEPFGNPETRAKMMSVSTDSPAYKRAMANTLAVVNGEVPDPTNGATHFLNKQTSASRGDSAMQPGGWAHTGADQVQIGRHTFMKADAGATGSGRLAYSRRAQSGPRAEVVGSPEAQTPGVGRSERVPLPPSRPSGILGGNAQETASLIDKQTAANRPPEAPRPGLDAGAGLGSAPDAPSPLRAAGGILAPRSAMRPLGRGTMPLGQGVLAAAAKPSAPPAALAAAQAGTIAPLVPKQLQAAIAPIARNEDLPGWGTSGNQGRTFAPVNVGARPNMPGAPPPAPAPAPIAPGILAPLPVDPDRMVRDQAASLAPPPAPSAAAPSSAGLASLSGLLSPKAEEAPPPAPSPPVRLRRPMAPSPELQAGRLLPGGVLSNGQGPLDLDRFYGLLSGRGG